MEDLTKLNRREVWKHINGELNTTQNGRGQVLLIHLYCDYFLNQLYSFLTQKPIEKIEQLRFKDKREFLYKNKIIDDSLNKDLIIVNKIRNELGHNLTPKPDFLLEVLKGHSNYWAEKVMKDLGTYGKIRFVTIDSVSKTFELFWKIIIHPTLKKIKS